MEDENVKKISEDGGAENNPVLIDENKNTESKIPAESPEYVDDVVFDENLDDSEAASVDIKVKIAKLKKKLQACEEEKKEYLNGWQRAKADLINATKRFDQEKNEIINFANENLISEIIPVLDSFTMAFSNKEAWEKADKNWRTGVEYIHSKLLQVLNQNGFLEYDPTGETFDPARHSSVENIEVADEKLNHKIVEVMHKGYELNGKVIRPAMVKVAEYKAK